MPNSGNTCYVAAAVQFIATLDAEVSVATHVASAADPEFRPRAADSQAQATQRADRLAEASDATQRRALVYEDEEAALPAAHGWTGGKYGGDRQLERLWAEAPPARPPLAVPWVGGSRAQARGGSCRSDTVIMPAAAAHAAPAGR